MTAIRPETGAPETTKASDAATREREEARKRVEARRGLFSDVVSYVVVNAFLIALWAFTGRGYFWPGWVLAGWGAVIVLHAWDVFWRRPVSEADIDAEMRRRR